MDSVEKYDITAPSYDALYRSEQFRKYDAVKEILEALKGKRILDVGCGTGLLIEYLKNNGLDNYAEYVCLEPSIEMIRRAVIRAHGDPRIIFYSSLCEDSLFLHDYFDFVFLFTVWENIVYRGKCLENIIHTMKHDGLLIISIIGKNKGKTKKPHEISNKIKVIDEVRAKDHIYMYSKTLYSHPGR